MSPFPEIGRYQLLKRLAIGGMGEVYLARQRSSVEGFARLFAIKILLPSYSTNASFVNMFLDEARVAAKLHHKNIVQVLDIDRHADRYYIVMEYIAGQNLRELLGDASIPGRSLFAPRLGAEIFGALAGALVTVHAAGLIHRDISPNNIMVSDTGEPKLIDFGVTRATSSVSLTTPGTLKGKFGYMAPEYVRGHGYDHRADVFSLGIVMWETFCRKRLFRGTSMAEQLHRLLETEIPRVDEVVDGFPAPLAEVIAVALQREPGARFPSAGALATALAHVAHDLPISADSSLGGWLERRLASRIAERKRMDEAFLGMASDAEIPAFDEAALGPAMSAGSMPGTFGLYDSGGSTPVPPPPSRPSASQQIAEFAAKTDETAGTSVRQAAGEVQGPARGARSGAGRRWVAVAAVAVIAVVAVVAIWVSRVTPVANPSPLPTPAVAPAVAPPAVAGSSTIDLAEAHRRIGIKALADKDFTRARLEFTEAINQSGASPDLSELVKLATELEASSTTRVAVAPAPPEALPAAALVAPPTKAVEHPRSEPARPAPRPDPRRLRIEPKRPDRETETPAPAAAAESPAPPPPAITGLGDLIVTSTPPGLVVRVDGSVVGQTALRIPISVGKHEVSIVQADRIVHVETATIREKDQTFVDFDAPPAPPIVAAPSHPAEPAPLEPPRSTTPVAPARAAPVASGEILVLSPQVAGEVWVNGQPYGTAPRLVKKIAAGDAVVEIRADGRSVRSSKVTVVEHQRARVEFR